MANSKFDQIPPLDILLAGFLILGIGTAFIIGSLFFALRVARTNGSLGDIKNSGVVSDMNNTSNNVIEFMKYNEDIGTLNSPRKEGITTSGTGVAISNFSGGSYGVQFCISQAAPRPFIRVYTKEWKPWEELALKSDLDSALRSKGGFTSDFNDINISPGIYLINGIDTYANGPKTWKPSYCIFVQYPYFRMQHLISTNKSATRRYVGNPAAWEPWNIYSSETES